MFLLKCTEAGFRLVLEDFCQHRIGNFQHIFSLMDVHCH